VGGIGSGSCSVACFGIKSVEPSGLLPESVLARQ
jgi:hypothetical protein